MRSLWETMLWQWLGRQGMAARGEYADLLGADSVRLTLAFAVRREAAAIGHADWPARSIRPPERALPISSKSA
jgi:hypothetical protein